MQSEIEVKPAIDVSCLIKDKQSQYEHEVVIGYLIDEQELVLRECRVLKSVNSVNKYLVGYKRLDDGKADYMTFREDKAVALKYLRQKAEKAKHHAEVTLQAMDAYDALVEKGLVDASEEIQYTTGIDMGSPEGDYTIIQHKDGSFEKITPPSKPAKAKTGRRESARKVTLHEGPRVGRAAACGHAVVANSAPHTKCFDCWHLYFSTNVKQTYALFSFLENSREAELVAVHGSKFVTQFKKYVSHVQSMAPIQAEDAVTVGAE